MSEIIGTIHDGVPADGYHADAFDLRPSLSASIAHQLVTSSPRHAWANHPRLNPNYQPVSDDKFDMGTACHALLLEGLNVVEVCDFPDWRTKAAKEARELARSHGRIPLLGHQYDDVLAMHTAVAEQISALDLDPLPLTEGKPESTIVWEDDGVVCRSRLDWLLDDYTQIHDIKTRTRSGHPDEWCRGALYDHGCDIQAAAYIRAVKTVTGVTPEFRWILIETNSPYAVSVVAPTAAVLTLGEAKWEKALSLWRGCLANDEWPAYGTGLHHAELPPWIEARWIEREAREEMAA